MDNLIKEKFADLDGHRIRYLESGQGKALILIHGLGGSANTWKANFPEFSKYFHTYAPDLIGFGHSDKPRIGYTMEVFCRFIGNFMDHQGLEKAMMLGMSMGGQIAATYALEHSYRVSKLILACSAGVSDEETRGLVTYTNLDTTKKGTRRRLSALVRDHSTITNDMLEDACAFINMEGSRDAFLSALENSWNAPRLIPRIKSVRVPTLILWGREDRIIPVEYAYDIHANIQASELSIFDDCGHLVHVEKKREFERRVIGFLRK